MKYTISLLMPIIILGGFMYSMNVATAGRYDGIIDLGIGKRFNHVSEPPRWTQLDNSLGGKTTITNKPTNDPVFAGQRFENFKMTDGNGNTIGKDTFIYDHNGSINAIK